MIKLYFDRQKTVEIKDLSSINFGEAFPGETKEVKFYIAADTDMRDINIEIKDPSNQIIITQPPSEMNKDEIWEGTCSWKAGLNPPEQKPSFKISGTEVLGWGD